MKNIFKEIEEERLRQDQKFGINNYQPVIWCNILGEEVGEVNKAALEDYHDRTDDKHKNLKNYREELIQVAAVAVAAIESFDRNQKELVK